MPVSAASVVTSKMELTPMRVSFKGPGALSFVDLGGTLSNVSFSSEYSMADILADQSGSTPRDKRVSGQKFEVTTELTQIREKDIWKVVFPFAKLVTVGLNKQMYFDASIGASAVANAGQLKLHPLSLPDADLSGDYLFYVACSTAKSEIVYGPSEQAKLKIVWQIFPDDSVSPERFFIHGDPSIGLVAASAASPVAGGGNVGNGTISGVSVFSGSTKTETITLTCIHAATNAGIFEVDGSLSGALGNATVGVGFSSSVIALTINDGTTDFAVGDSFTIATTAANYA